MTKSTLILRRPDEWKTLNDMRARGPDALKRVIVSEGVETIWERQFQKRDVESVALPASLREIREDAFRHCANLKEIRFHKQCNVNTLSKNCFCESGLEAFVAPPSLRKIENAAFYGCKALKTVALNEGLLQLGDDGDTGVFYGSGLERIALPKTLWQIGNFTF